MLELTAGQKYIVCFMIDGQPAWVECIFTGDYVVVNDENLYILQNASTKKEYGFTKRQLDDYVGINSPDARESVETLTVG